MASAIATKLAGLKKKQAALAKEMKDTAKAAFKEMIGDVFESNPNLISFGWSQYTPYWNDGDTCTFSSYHEYPSITFKAADGKILKNDENNGTLVYLDDKDDLEFEVEEADYETYSKQVEKLSKPVTKFLSNFSDDDFLTMFGDHQLVTVNRNGKIDSEDYEHE
jgi:hypothetical protein